MQKISVFFLSLCLLVMFAACGSDQEIKGTQAITPTSKPVKVSQTLMPKSTPMPKSRPAKVSQTPMPKSTLTPVAYAYLGNNVSVFKQAFGNPSNIWKDHYTWDHRDGSWLAVSTDGKDSSFHHGNDGVYDISQNFNPPMATKEEHNVSLSVAKSVCEKFKPTDSQLLRTETHEPEGGAPGIQYIYKSKSLSRQIDPMWFYANALDESNVPPQNTPVEPGTYTLFYEGSNAGGYDVCFLTTGINWPLGF